MLEEAKEFYSKKIRTIDELQVLLTHKQRNKRIVMCHGVFDIVHPGHVRHMIFAKSKGDLLIVSLTADKHIKKGATRPHVPEQLRAINLAAFEMVDYVLIDQNAEPYENIKKIKPNYFAKGYEYVANNPKTIEEKQIVESYGGEMLFTPGDIVYSSSKWIELSAPKIGDEKLMLLMENENISFDAIHDAICSLSGFKLHVVGDSIVDSYTQCSMIGGMTKTPTMSVRYERRLDYIGGAAIVAKHLKAAGAEVVFSTVLGDDPFQELVLEDLRKAQVECIPYFDATRPTTQKNAIVVGDYRLLKIDTVDNRPISDKALDMLIKGIATTKADGIVFSDFRHGIFNPTSIPKLIDAIPQGMFRVADSQVASRWGNILDFPGFDLITPNEREARFSLGDQDSIVRHLGETLFNQSQAKNLFLKLGDRGVLVFRKGLEHDSFFIDSFTDQAIDPVGAGDAMLAYATLAFLRTKHVAMAAIIGSLAAALECEREGNIPITPKEILDRLDSVKKRTNYATI